MKSKYKLSTGFTLIELLVVIAVIGLLASVIMVSLNSAKAKARDTKRKADLKQVATALNLYYDENNFLPGNASGWCSLFIHGATGFTGNAMPAPLLTKYMSSIPYDPIWAGDGNPNSYTADYLYYNVDNTNGKFTLCANFEQDPGSLTVTCGTNYKYCISQ
ncbi:MAG: hypothetical protein A2751_03580 [Candidatus Doudnabacteria bacterium RIFCSPHIGHO2_01_FULL_46_14]|uniref:Type II secretion system protein GspG C-terminal domain-containing protein n=1 Tax=Candidatus Doudnabacteria bacterium RIFCSPHIGHO2_01_FULL_46_14 TaxID=1817824 RepID=A0A1F5NKH7_9BACT|nr:MAG: hypothetical protein A2751_03580 [Candidatus Doudnabacteria bacterium RIFCSPHIGHO2_01_FULL_46_14]